MGNTSGSDVSHFMKLPQAITIVDRGQTSADISTSYKLNSFQLSCAWWTCIPVTVKRVGHQPLINCHKYQRRLRVSREIRANKVSSRSYWPQITLTSVEQYAGLTVNHTLCSESNLQGRKVKLDQRTSLISSRFLPV